MEEINLKSEENKNNNKNGWAIIIIAVGFIIAIFGIYKLVESDGINTKSTKIEITNTSLSTEYYDYLGYSASIKGTAKNLSGKNYSYVSIEYSVYDQNGNNLGTAMDNINNLRAGDTWKFEATLFSYPSSKPYSYKLVEIYCW